MNTRLFFTIFFAIVAAGLGLYWLIRHFRQVELAQAQLRAAPKGEIGFASLMRRKEHSEISK